MYRTKVEVLADVSEKELDLRAFKEAQRLIYERLVASQDADVKSSMPLHNWAGATGVYDILPVLVTRLEDVVTDLRAVAESEEYNKKTGLFLVKNEVEYEH